MGVGDPARQAGPVLHQLARRALSRNGPDLARLWKGEDLLSAALRSRSSAGQRKLGGGVSGFDTGPANCLLDAWVQQHLGAAYDHDGEWAAGGGIVPGLLEDMLADPYFEKPAPKSTGIEYFNLSWLEQYDVRSSLDPRDVQATLVELSAISIAQSIRPHQPADVLVCGGGVHNSNLLRRLQAALRDIAVRSTADLGLDPDWVEAVLFAWLARERLADRQLDTGSITGAKSRVLLGVVVKPS